MPGVYYSPFRIVMKTHAWVPLVLVSLAIIFALIAGLAGRTASALETTGVVTQATVTGKERRERRDSEGRTRVSHYVAYSFVAGAGQRVSARPRVDRAFFNSVQQGGSFPLRYLPTRPSTHEYRIGSYRSRSDTNWFWAALALVAALASAGWLATQSAPLLRALRGGTARRAVVTGHVSKPRKRYTGKRKGRLRWRDETGAEGISGLVPMLDVVGHPVGSRITVLVDSRSGRAYWEEELAGGGDGMAGLGDAAAGAGAAGLPMIGRKLFGRFLR